MNSFSPNFKIAIAFLLVPFLFAIGIQSANAQSATQGLQSTNDAAAVNSGVSTTFNSYGTPLSVIQSQGRQDVNTNQAFGAPPAFSSPAVIGTCATAGFGLGLQAVGGGGSISTPGGTDAGCDLARDLQILKTIDAPHEVALQRACQKAEIAKAMADAGRPCKVASQKTADASLSSDPLIRQRQLSAN